LVTEGLLVTDSITNKKQIAIPTRNGRWKINTGGNQYRYFTQKELDSRNLRKNLEQLPQEIKQIRNNVEAAMFQISLYTRNNKTRYRGKIK